MEFGKCVVDTYNRLLKDTVADIFYEYLIKDKIKKMINFPTYAEDYRI